MDGLRGSVRFGAWKGGVLSPALCCRRGESGVEHGKSAWLDADEVVRAKGEAAVVPRLAEQIDTRSLEDGMGSFVAGGVGAGWEYFMPKGN